jgi:hypothetical protein
MGLRPAKLHEKLDRLNSARLRGAAGGSSILGDPAFPTDWGAFSNLPTDESVYPGQAKEGLAKLTIPGNNGERQKYGCRLGLGLQDPLDACPDHRVENSRRSYWSNHRVTMAWWSNPRSNSN